MSHFAWHNYHVFHSDTVETRMRGGCKLWYTGPTGSNRQVFKFAVNFLKTIFPRNLTCLGQIHWSDWKVHQTEAIEHSFLYMLGNGQSSEVKIVWSGYPGQGHCVELGHLTLTVHLSTQEYIWSGVNLMLGVTLWWTSPQSIICPVIFHFCINIFSFLLLHFYLFYQF